MKTMIAVLTIVFEGIGFVGFDLSQRVNLVTLCLLIRNRFSGARAPARLPVRVRTQTGWNRSE